MQVCPLGQEDPLKKGRTRHNLKMSPDQQRMQRTAPPSSQIPYLYYTVKDCAGFGGTHTKALTHQCMQPTRTLSTHMYFNQKSQTPAKPRLVLLYYTCVI